MDLSNYTLEDLFITAIKSEIDSRRVYATQANRVKNIFLKEKLRFLSAEEEKHRILLEDEFHRKFPGKKIIVPKKSPVPLPELNIPEEELPIADALEKAMEVELAARDYYLSLSEIVENPPHLRRTLEFVVAVRA